MNVWAVLDDGVHERRASLHHIPAQLPESALGTQKVRCWCAASALGRE